MTKALGIDYGTKKVGIAISNDDKTLAFPREVMPTDEHLVEFVAQLCETEHIDTIVVGESLDNKGKPNPVMEKIREFAEQIQQRTGITPQFVSEAFTSVQARKMQDVPYRNTTGGGRDMMDASAAALILQTYLDQKQN